MTRLVEAKLKANEASAEAPFLNSGCDAQNPESAGGTGHTGGRGLPRAQQVATAQNARQSLLINQSLNQGGYQYAQQDRPQRLIEQAQTNQ